MMQHIMQIRLKGEMKMATSCFKCGKEIKRQGVYVTYPIYLKSMGFFDRQYHKGCYLKEQREAEKELAKRK